MFGHTERVKRRFEQLEALDELIKERTLVTEELQKQIDELADAVVFLKNKYKDLFEYEELNAQISKINQEIEEKERELKSLLTKIETYNTLIELEKVKQELEEEKQKLNKFKSTLYKTTDLIILAYRSTDEDFLDISINLFYLSHKESYNNDDDDDDMECIGFIYKSIDEDRTVGFNHNFSNYLINNGTENDTILNATPIAFITFSEACRKINSELHLKEYISIEELHLFLATFLKKYTFAYNKDKEKYTIIETKKRILSKEIIYKY